MYQKLLNVVPTEDHYLFLKANLEHLVSLWYTTSMMVLESLTKNENRELSLLNNVVDISKFYGYFKSFQNCVTLHFINFDFRERNINWKGCWHEQNSSRS